MNDLDDLARRVLGLTELRPEQRRAAGAVVDGRDVLAVLPTGSGKSAIYQLAGLARGGTTLVVSPMIALQHDQVRSLQDRPRPDGDGTIAVAAVNSSQTAGERRDALARWRGGELDVVLLGPEQLENRETRETLAASARPVGLVAVDEAHLVSEWGHEFRPDYLHLDTVIDELGHPPVLALTATAAPPVRTDIVENLGMRNPLVIVSGFDRPNIDLAVRITRAEGNAAQVNEAVEDAALATALELPAPQLVYAPSRAACERLAERLTAGGRSAEPYHAGLARADRIATQDRFLGGDLDVVVATSAFGMGIDKPDVRSVVHAGPPGSLDEYYQEIGRAGRDGRPAQAVLVFAERALALPKLFAARSRLDDESVRRVVNRLLAHHGPGPIELDELAERADVPRHTTARIVDELVEARLVSLGPDGITVPPDAPRSLRADGAEEVEAAAARREAVMTSRIDAVRRYATTRRCRRADLLGYFAEEYDPPCGHCDNDRRGADREAPVAPEGVTDDQLAAVHAGDAVVHDRFGAGTVTGVDAHEIVVAFDDVGYKTLTTAVLSNGLLRTAEA